MTDGTRWSSVLDIAWASIVTFERRRLDFLEWVESNVEPVAFVDDQDQVGVAIGSGAQQLLLSRQGLQVQLNSWDAQADELLPAIDKALATMVSATSAAVVVKYRSNWSVGVDGAYDEVRRRVATRVLHGATESDDVSVGVAYDSAVLIDLLWAGIGTTQLEFGIVSADELRERVTDPNLGRVPTHSRSQQVETPEGAGRPLPETSVFLGLTCDTRELQGGVTGSSDVAETLSRLDQRSRSVLLAIAQAV